MTRWTPHTPHRAHAIVADAPRLIATDLDGTLLNMMVFGAGIDDLAMFDFAGVSVAIANASPSVRGTASEIMASNDGDGVALVIEARSSRCDEQCAG